jgi:hypothetical protein
MVFSVTGSRVAAQLPAADARQVEITQLMTSLHESKESGQPLSQEKEKDLLSQSTKLFPVFVRQLNTDRKESVEEDLNSDDEAMLRDLLKHAASYPPAERSFKCESVALIVAAVAVAGLAVGYTIMKS